MICPNGHGLKGGNYCGRCGARVVEEPAAVHCPWCRAKVATAPHWEEINSAWFVDSFCFICGRQFLDADRHLVVVPWWVRILAKVRAFLMGRL